MSVCAAGTSRRPGEQSTLAAQLDDHTGGIEHDPADVSLQRSPYGHVGNDRDTAGGLTAASREVAIGEIDGFRDEAVAGEPFFETALVDDQVDEWRRWRRPW